jgi:hypothetical protein
MRKGNRFSAVCTAAGLFLVSGLLLAHHSNSIYDEETCVSLTGTVSKFEFINPHVLIHLDVKDAAGNVVTWATLGGPPNRMSKGSGWTSKTFRQGEELTIVGFPFRDGRAGMLFQKIMRADGEVVPLSETVTSFSRRQDREIPISRQYGAKSK